MWQPATRSHSTCEDWVRSTAALPIAFAQVREDPLLDVHLVQHLNRPARVVMVASGGETAALLATLPLDRLQLVDINAAQLSLARLKLQLLTTTDTTERLRLLGHTPMPVAERSNELRLRLAELDLHADALGPPELVSQYGPDHCGRYEWLFARMRELLTDRAEEIRALMLLREPGRQAGLVAEGTGLGDAIEAAFTETMDLPRLIRIFGPDATANRLQPFSNHFLEQTRRILAAMPAADNPFLHQIFLGTFLGPVWPWLSADRQQASLPETQYSHAAMDVVLRSMPPHSADFIHLSNILDWIKPAEAKRLLENAYRCLSPGGLVVIRQLNSRLDIARIPGEFQWMHDLSEQLHRSDRSFFYRSLHVGMKP